MKIQCTFNTGGFWKILEDQYQCDTGIDTLEVSTKNTVVDGFNGEHADGKANRDVKGFFMYGKRIKFLPKNIATHFPNLEGLWLHNTDIAEITREDLKFFTESILSARQHFDYLTFKLV